MGEGRGAYFLDEVYVPYLWGRRVLYQWRVKGVVPERALGSWGEEKSLRHF